MMDRSPIMIYQGAKRVMDILVSSIALILFAPIILITCLLVKLYDGGPAFFNQARVGRNGRLIKFYKIRSMRADAESVKHKLLHLSDAEGSAFKMKQDPRITPIGRFIRKYSIDEMPQLYLVLIGEMSIVGPRPHLPGEVASYSPSQRDRLMVKPGLLCLREISGRSHLTFQEWVDLDLQYVRSRSLWLDIKIFMRAIWTVTTGKGAY